MVSDFVCSCFFWWVGMCMCVCFILSFVVVVCLLDCLLSKEKEKERAWSCMDGEVVMI